MCGMRSPALVAATWALISHPDIGELHATRRVVIIGMGEPTGTSPKFAGMIKSAVEVFLREKGVRLEAYGEGKEVEQGGEDYSYPA